MFIIGLTLSPSVDCCNVYYWLNLVSINELLQCLLLAKVCLHQWIVAMFIIGLTLSPSVECCNVYYWLNFVSINGLLQCLLLA